ncbi:sulfite exporter TauE/SafE family protein [Longispora sp. NPDC051575]|uniref:sulfite exporter TauE/SafE family protein n=1 Tax=Longispora sp. NPDC051575 TaxID=3154943 RepID=UPI003421041C
MNVPLLLTAGLAAGAVNAIAGGGSLITFPALIAAGLSPVTANVSNSIAATGGYLASVAGSWKDLDRKKAARLIPTALAGAAVGCAVLLNTPAAAFEAVVPFLVLAASLALLVPKKEARETHPAVLHLTIFGLSTYAGYFGAAVGVMLLAGLSLTLADKLTRVNALKNVISATTGLATAAIFGIFASVNWGAVALLLPATIIGGYLGARLARRVPAKVLRACVVVFGITIAAWLLFR